MSRDLKALYKSVILQHNKSPFYYEKKEEAPIILDAYNPLCGDRFNVFISLKDDVIENIHFHGYGCAISKASTSVLVKNLKGKKIAAALDFCHFFFDVVNPNGEDIHADQDELAAFMGARDFPERSKCATLAWEEIANYFKDYKNEH